jgi:hypothetical protein
MLFDQIFADYTGGTAAWMEFSRVTPQGLSGSRDVLAGRSVLDQEHRASASNPIHTFPTRRRVTLGRTSDDCVRISVTDAARDFTILGRLSIVPGVTSSVMAPMVLIFTTLSITESDPGRAVPRWFGPAMWTGLFAGIVLGWFSLQVRSGSRAVIGTVALTLTAGAFLIFLWRSVVGETVAIVVMAICLIVSPPSWWAFLIARRLQHQFPMRFVRPHASRRLSLPRDGRALRALVPAVLGSLEIGMAVAVAIAAAPLMQLGGFSVGFGIFGASIARHFRRVRAVLALRAQEVRLMDARAPVLLLRSFADDELTMARTKRLPFAPNFGGKLKIALSLEEQIVAQLWEIGPVIAIGQPGLELDPIGAPRERIVGTAWQPRVQALIRESQLIVVVLGHTEGLFWEYEQLSQHLVAVLAVIPPGERHVLEERWQRFSSAYSPARRVVLEEGLELPFLVWFQRNHEPFVVAGELRDERSYELAFAQWRQRCLQPTPAWAG